MEIGEIAEVKRTFRREDADGFGALTGAPIESLHTVPEPLIAALFSYLLGVKLPGPGTNYLKQDMQFLASAPLGEPLTASVRVSRLRRQNQLVDLETSCRRADGTEICRGRALVLFTAPAGID